MSLQEDKLPSLTLFLAEEIADELEPGVRADFEGLEVSISRHGSSVYAGLYLYLPTAIGLFIAANFFNGFFNKAGGDAYDALKLAATALWVRANQIKVSTVGSRGKLADTNRFSLSYSIVVQVAPKLRLKFLTEDNVDEETAERGISTFLELLANLPDLEEAELERLLFTYRPVGGHFLVAYDAASQKIVPVNAFGKGN